MAKGKDTATKEKVKDTTTTNKEEKEQKENQQHMFATDVDNQDTWPSNAGRDTNDQTDDWYNQAHYDNNWYHQDQSQMNQLALPQPPRSRSISSTYLRIT